MELIFMILFAVLGHLIHIVLKYRVDYQLHPNGFASFTKKFFSKEAVWIVTSLLLIIGFTVIWHQSPDTLQIIPLKQTPFGAALAGYGIDSLLKNVMGKNPDIDVKKEE